MNKKEEFLKKITEETKKQKIDWEPADIITVSDYVANSNDIVRVIKTSYRDFNLYYVEKKFRNTDPDTDDIVEHVRSYILGENDGHLVLKIYPSEIADWTYDEFCKAIKGKIEETALDELLSDDEDNGSAQ